MGCTRRNDNKLLDARPRDRTLQGEELAAAGAADRV
jgi:hypothetical protein